MKTKTKNKKELIAQIKGIICLKYPEIGFLATKTYIPRRKYRELRKGYNNILPSSTFIETHWGSYKSFMDMWSTTDPRIIKRGEVEEIDETNKPSGQKDDGGYIVEAEGVLYNPNTEDYVFDFTNVSNIANVITIKKTQLLAILQDYSNFDNNPQTVAEIALKHKIPTFILEKVLNKLRFRHNSLPVTSSYLSEINDDDKVVEDLASLRKFRVAEKYNHLQWKNIQQDAIKWNQFEQGSLNPLRDFLSVWEPKSYCEIPTPSSNKIDGDKDKTFLISLSDIHFGNKIDSSTTFYTDQDWTIDKATVALKQYVDSIEQFLKDMKTPPQECVVVSTGDIIHSVSGVTDKGTPLEVDVKGPKQFQIALDAMTMFFSKLIQVWNKFSSGRKIKVKAVSGNHDSFGDWVLFTCLSRIFKDQIDFDIESSRWLFFQLGKNIFVMEHGASAKYHSPVPGDDKSKENYVQKLLLEKLGEFSTPILNRYFLMGHKHHYTQKEMSSFELIQLPALIPSDGYADAHNLSSRTRQLCFVVDNDNGITQTISFFC